MRSGLFARGVASARPRTITALEKQNANGARQIAGMRKTNKSGLTFTLNIYRTITAKRI